MNNDVLRMTDSMREGDETAALRAELAEVEEVLTREANEAHAEAKEYGLKLAEAQRETTKLWEDKDEEIEALEAKLSQLIEAAEAVRKVADESDHLKPWWVAQTLGAALDKAKS